MKSLELLVLVCLMVCVSLRVARGGWLQNWRVPLSVGLSTLAAGLLLVDMSEGAPLGLGLIAVTLLLSWFLPQEGAKGELLWLLLLGFSACEVYAFLCFEPLRSEAGLLTYGLTSLVLKGLFGAAALGVQSVCLERLKRFDDSN